MQPAQRLERTPMYVFAALAAKLKALQAQGLDVIRLDIGSPDGPPPDFVVDALYRYSQVPTNHSYPTATGMPAFRQAIADYYLRRFGVELDVDNEIVPLLGSKEGIAHMALAWLDPGDLALVPDPGYPAYRMGTAMAGAESYFMPLLPEQGFLPDLDAIPLDVARRARLMWLNYPNNPTGGTADLPFLERAVAFCREHDILLCHDAPYADVTFDGYRAPSVLSVPGAKEVALEFNSLSKSHNMAGWRVGMVVGNRQAGRALLQLKSNVDSGMFVPLQQAACAALTGDQTWMEARNAEYQHRRDLIHSALTDGLHLEVQKPLASLYLWPHVPAGYTSATFVEHVLMNTGVSLTPGNEFGPHGEGYVRISLGQVTDRVEEAVKRLRSLKL